MISESSGVALAGSLPALHEALGFIPSIKTNHQSIISQLINHVDYLEDLAAKCDRVTSF